MLLLLLLLALRVVAGAPAETLTLRILHTNDMHSRFEQTSQSSSICGDKAALEGRCYGGFARLATLIRAARRKAAHEDLPTFFLNAGDTYQGSDLFTHWKWTIVAKFLNILQPDVVSLGNHEFDNKVEGLVPFLRNVSFPVVAANLDYSLEPSLQGIPQLRKSVVLEAKGRKIGVVGYLTPETRNVARPGRVGFLDEVAAVRAEADRLAGSGCEIIVALGHSGYEVDMRIAREVDKVDLVIGGHTNTFLYTGEPPDEERVEGLYPTEVLQPGGRRAYVVQAYAYTKYLGDLSVDFDARGEVTRIAGSPVLVDASVPQAQDVLDELKLWAAPLEYLKRPVGTTRVKLQGDSKICRAEECNFGNLIADAMVYYNAKQFVDRKSWTDAAIAVVQSGGIRGSIDTSNLYEVTLRDVRSALPFGEPGIFKVQMDGKTLWSMLEWSVYLLNRTSVDLGGAFLQVSGLQVVYDLSKPPNSRVVSVQVRCSSCMVPNYENFHENASYSVLMPGFLHGGGDKYNMLKNLPYKDLGVNASSIVVDFINHTSPVSPAVEGRLKFVIDSRESLQPSSSSPKNYAYELSFILVLLNFLACNRLY